MGIVLLDDLFEEPSGEGGLITNGLIFYMPFNEGSGEPQDQSGNNLDATLVGAPTWVPNDPPWNGSLDFANVGDSALLVSSSTVPVYLQGVGNNNDYTICCFIKDGTSAVGSYWRPGAIIMELRKDGSVEYRVPFSFGLNSGLVSIGRSRDVSTPPEVGDTDVSGIASWTNVAARVTVDDVDFLINGSIDASRTFPAGASGDVSVGTAVSSMHIAVGQRDGGQLDRTQLKGPIYDLRLYNRALTDQELLSITAGTG